MPNNPEYDPFRPGPRNDDRSINDMIGMKLNDETQTELDKIKKISKWTWGKYIPSSWDKNNPFYFEQLGCPFNYGHDQILTQIVFYPAHFVVQETHYDIWIDGKKVEALDKSRLYKIPYSKITSLRYLRRNHSDFSEPRSEVNRFDIIFKIENGETRDITLNQKFFLQGRNLGCNIGWFYEIEYAEARADLIWNLIKEFANNCGHKYPAKGMYIEKV